MEMKIKTEKHTQRDTHTCTLMRRGTVYSTYLKCLQVANNKSNERKRIIKCKESVRACVCVCFSLSCTSACVCVRLSASLTGCTTACVCVIDIINRASRIVNRHLAFTIAIAILLMCFLFSCDTTRRKHTHIHIRHTVVNNCRQVQREKQQQQQQQVQVEVVYFHFHACHTWMWLWHLQLLLLPLSQCVGVSAQYIRHHKYHKKKLINWWRDSCSAR